MTSYWNAFLPIGETIKSDELGLDPVWASTMGVDKDALLVLRRVRQDVLPLVRNFQKRKVLRSFSFLIHDRSSGVPCPPEDASAYIHLRYAISGSVESSKRLRCDSRSRSKFLDTRWVYVTKIEPSVEEIRVQEILCKQSAWYLDLIESASEMSDIHLLKHIGQHLHYFANMAQMMVR